MPAGSAGSHAIDVTTTCTTAQLLNRAPSLALNAKVSVPAKSANGVYVATEPSTINEPCSGEEPRTYDNASPSASVASSVMLTGVPCSVVALASAATGALFRSITRHVNVVLAVRPSSVVTVN